MKRLLVVLTVLSVFSAAAFAQMGPRARWWHDGRQLGLGNGLWRGYLDRYRDSRYFWNRVYDETENKVMRGCLLQTGPMTCHDASGQQDADSRSGVPWPVRGKGDAILPATGQTRCYDVKGQLYLLRRIGTGRRIPIGARWPDPRFEESGSMVVDRLTRLSAGAHQPTLPEARRPGRKRSRR